MKKQMTNNTDSEWTRARKTKKAVEAVKKEKKKLLKPYKRVVKKGGSGSPS